MSSGLGRGRQALRLSEVSGDMMLRTEPVLSRYGRRRCLCEDAGLFVVDADPFMVDADGFREDARLRMAIAVLPSDWACSPELN